MHNPWRPRDGQWVRQAETVCRCRTCGRDTWPHQPMYEVREQLGNELHAPSLYFCGECLEARFNPSLF